MAKQKTGSSLFILIFVLVAVVAGSGMFVYAQYVRDTIVPEDSSQTFVPPKKDNSKPIVDNVVKPTPNPDEWVTYTSTSQGFKISHPQNMTVSESSALMYAPKIEGTKFAYPASMSAGTNLNSGAISVARISGTCPRDWSGMKTGGETYSVSGNTFVKTTVGDSAMGGARAMAEIYSMEKNNYCYIVQQALLYRDIEFLRGAGVVNLPKPYDQAALDSIFFRMLATFAITN